jgi:hypothetical protein
LHEQRELAREAEPSVVPAAEHGAAVAGVLFAGPQPFRVPDHLKELA